MPRGTDELTAAAEAAMSCLGVDAGEDVLVVFNEQQRVVAEALAAVAERACPRRSAGRVPGADA